VSRDRGSLTVWAAALAGLLWFGSTAAVLYGSAVVGRHRTETAADLAALAAAVHVPDGDASACSTAAVFADRNGAEVRSCRIIGTDVEVTVSRRVGFGGLGAYTSVVRARAGPVDHGP
jgi:secretion/DNA translocation related TadE-like protein